MIVIKRQGGADRAPLTWNGLKTPEGRSATLVCPNGHYAALTDHRIGEDGTVSPSVICPQCGFHENVRLEGWEA